MYEVVSVIVFTLLKIIFKEFVVTITVLLLEELSSLEFYGTSESWSREFQDAVAMARNLRTAVNITYHG